MDKGDTERMAKVIQDLEPTITACTVRFTEDPALATQDTQAPSAVASVGLDSAYITGSTLGLEVYLAPNLMPAATLEPATIPTETMNTTTTNPTIIKGSTLGLEACFPPTLGPEAYFPPNPMPVATLEPTTIPTEALHTTTTNPTMYMERTATTPLQAILMETTATITI